LDGSQALFFSPLQFMACCKAGEKRTESDNGKSGPNPQGRDYDEPTQRQIERERF
jgi:hypothetical protein